MSCFDDLRGLLPASMLDWPGRLCSVLFLGGCNFRCPYCHNPELLAAAAPGELIDWEEVRDYLRGRRGWIDGVCISGGEPTLHADLPELCRGVRDMGMLVKVDTNGSRPRVLKELISGGLVDCVAMDVKASLERYRLVARARVDTGDIEESIDAIIASGLEHEFRCTVVPGLVDLADLKKMARRLQGARVLVLNRFNSHETLDPGYRGRPGYGDDLLLRWAEELSRTVDTRVRGTLKADMPTVAEVMS